MVKGYLSLYLHVHILLCASSMTILTIYNYLSFCFTASTVIISCMDACSLNNVTFPVCAFNNSSESFLQQGSEKQTVFLKVFINYSDFQNTPSICQVSRTELQPYILNSTCESEDDMNVVHQGSRSEVPEVRGSLDMKAKKIISFHKHFNFTVGYVNEESEEYNIYYILEVLIRNSTTRRGNTTEESINHSCIAAMTEDQNGCINISLQLQPYVEKLIFLIFISLFCQSFWHSPAPFEVNAKIPVDFNGKKVRLQCQCHDAMFRLYSKSSMLQGEVLVQVVKTVSL
uniref:Transmembrane protein 156 n=1 Tax=Terrapene triunguis TaxID=2587831 RepID=A0A674HZW4_9SAUR